MNWHTMNLIRQAENVLAWQMGSPWAPQLHLTGNRQFDVYYAPFEHINPQARLVIVGITPGVTQAALALKEAKLAMQEGEPIELALARAKSVASFGGPMRKNLVAMMDHIGLADWLGVDSAAALFGADVDKVQFTSVLRFPVLERSEMLSNAEVALRDPMLKELMEATFVEECQSLSGALFLPLGKGVERVLMHLANHGVIPKEAILAGMPHPSGANSERIQYFLGNKAKEKLSAKTNPDKLDAVRTQLIAQVTKLMGPVNVSRWLGSESTGSAGACRDSKELGNLTERKVARGNAQKKGFLSTEVERQIVDMAQKEKFTVSPVRSDTSKELELTRQCAYGAECVIYISRVAGVTKEQLHIMVAPDVWEAKQGQLHAVTGLLPATPRGNNPWNFSSNYKGFKNKVPGVNEYFGRKLLLPYSHMDALVHVLQTVAS